MASIYSRTKKDGSVVWRVLFRRVGFPSKCFSFRTEIEANKFALLEREFIFNHDDFMNSLPDFLEMKRKREFE